MHGKKSGPERFPVFQYSGPNKIENCYRTDYLCSSYSKGWLVNDTDLLSTIVLTPQSTQSGNGYFLAYMPSWWSNQPSRVRMVGARPPPFTLSTITSKVVVYTLQLSGQIHSTYFSSTPLCALWLTHTQLRSQPNIPPPTSLSPASISRHKNFATNW